MFKGKRDHDWSRQKTFQHRHRFHARRNIRNQFGRRVLSSGEIAVHARSKREKVQIMAVIHHSVNALLLRFAEEFLVGRDGGFIAMRPCKMVADTRVKVWLHVGRLAFRWSYFLQRRPPRRWEI